MVVICKYTNFLLKNTKKEYHNHTIMKLFSISQQFKPMKFICDIKGFSSKHLHIIKEQKIQS